MASVSDQEWMEYKTKFNKSYEDAEDAIRRERFALTKVRIEEHQRRFEAGLETYQMALNHLADYTEEEVGRLCGSRRPPK